MKPASRNPVNPGEEDARLGDAAHDEIARYRRLVLSITPCIIAARPRATSDCERHALRFEIQSATRHALDLFGATTSHQLVGAALSDLVARESAATLDLLAEAAWSNVEVEPVIALVRTFDGANMAVRVTAMQWTPDSICFLFTPVARSEETSSRLQILEHRYGRLFNDVPIALMRVDSRGCLKLFAKVRAAGHDDLMDYLDAHPEDFEAALDSLVVVDANDQSVKMFGDGTKESVLCSVRSYFRLAPDALKRNLAASFSGAKHFTDETIICGAAGQERHVLFTIAYADPAELEGNSFVGMVDISDRLRAEAALQRTQAEFTRAARVSLMGELTASIAHEVMQPLSTITVNSGTALKWLTKDPPEIERAIRRMQLVVDDATRTAAIVHGMRKMASGGIGEQNDVDLNDVAQKALGFIQEEARSHSVRIYLLRVPSLPAVRADAIQLQQVVVNLVLNAVQAINDSGATRREVFVKIMTGPDRTIDLTIQDSGPGIAAEHLPRLFDSFFTTKSNGIGMGLAICRSIVENHGGTLTIENARAGGAIARVRMPLQDDVECEVGSNCPERVPEPPPSSTFV